MKQGFPNSIKIWKFYLEEFWPFNAFAILKTRFSNHRLIKISMIYLHIKLKLKINDTTAMTAAINEGFIGWLHENCYFVRWIFWWGKSAYLSLLGGILPNMQGFSQRLVGVQGSPYMAEATSEMKGRENFFVRWGIQGV